MNTVVFVNATIGVSENFFFSFDITFQNKNDYLTH